MIDVKPCADLKPLYYLIFPTRHLDGLVTFGEAASRGPAEMAAEGTLFSQNDTWEANWKAQEAALKAQWIDTLVERLTRELAKGEPICVVDRSNEVLGDLVGVVRGMHLRAAMKKVLAEGKTSTDPKGVDDLLNLRLKPT